MADLTENQRLLQIKAASLCSAIQDPARPEAQNRWACIHFYTPLADNPHTEDILRGLDIAWPEYHRDQQGRPEAEIMDDDMGAQGLPPFLPPAAPVAPHTPKIGRSPHKHKDPEEGDGQYDQ